MNGRTLEWLDGCNDYGIKNQEKKVDNIVVTFGSIASCADGISAEIIGNYLNSMAQKTM